ncbi:MAG: homoserine kinase type [Clostridiales bacterium]|jgi:Ser/Thr protein kinase RdoA (MazF antagonist)|nr:homoserine kinase type [Clostridiales bacterium]MDN5298189.1 homoserine kinase type [Clostridiales bacterium]
MKELAAIIQKAYQLEGVSFECLKCEEGYNEVYSMRASNGDAYIVKVHRDHFVDAKRLWQQQLFKVFLEAKGIQTMPYRLTIEGEPFCMLEDNPLTVEAKCSMFRETAFSVSKLRAIGAMLGNIHLWSDDFECQMKSGSQWRIFGSNLTNTLYDYDAVSRKIERLTERLPEHLSRYHTVRNRLRGMWDMLPEGIVHGDFGKYNLAFNDEEAVVGIVDFNLMGREKYVNELVQTAVLNTYIVNDKPFQWESGFAYLNDFISAYEQVRSLNVIEKDAIALIFRLSFLAYFGEKMPDVIITNLLDGVYDSAVVI